MSIPCCCASAATGAVKPLDVACRLAEVVPEAIPARAIRRSGTVYRHLLHRNLVRSTLRSESVIGGDTFNNNIKSFWVLHGQVIAAHDRMCMSVLTRFAPLPRFPVYALERWGGEDIQLDSVTLWRSPDAPDPVTRSIWLLHSSGADRALTVGSFASDLHGCGDQGAGGRVDAVALEAASMLDAVTVPTDFSGPRDAALVESLGRYGLARGREWRTWPAATWHVDGQPTPAYVWEFAGAWAGVAATLGGAALAVVGVGVASDDIRIATLQEKLIYGPVVDGQFDRTMESLRHDWRATGMPPPNQTGFHPDQRAAPHYDR